MSTKSASPLRPALSQLDDDELGAWLSRRGAPGYRLVQIRARYWAGSQFAAMQELPAPLRSDLERSFRSLALDPLQRLEADQGLTTKILYGLDGGYTVEAVLMRYARRSTLCISSQVGCPIGCPFCATGRGPFGRNLTPGEIVDQAVDAARILRAEGRQLTHVVFMGMGEPLANYDAVLEAIGRICARSGLGISPRRITVSTAGLVPRMTRLAAEGLPLTLAISLHAARDELRDELVPINSKYPLDQLIPAAREYARISRRRVSFEWVLLAGVNDTDRDARELIGLLRGGVGHVNLIPFNPVDGADYAEPEPARVRAFAARLTDGGLLVTVRDTRGRESAAACGQLRARALQAGIEPAPTLA
ncbi:MAG TPA: 23S rRNA (adenine(2503)-C(2))-methyltransferase RlmN [Candidatus Nitrosotalea sp.]|nr:23S rRNA (adenine(2503)-C(2))-methyltransferase RlmN [Candidatus Nitrosotalea sp.]